MLLGKATTTFVSLRNGLRVVRLSLFPTLRVQCVTADGQSIPFIQENKNDDADFAIILPKPLAPDKDSRSPQPMRGKMPLPTRAAGIITP